GSVTNVLRPRLGTVRDAAVRLNRIRQHVMARPGDLGGLAARVTQFGPDASPHLVDHVVGLAARAPSDVWTDGIVGLMEMDLRHAVHHVRVPALVIVGEHDRVTPPARAVDLASELPDGRLEMIAGAGHVPMMERHEDFNHAVEAFAAETLGRRRPRRPRKETA
ncbi:MAG TPA: alpha/beta fold hydrolase, partial [Actinomycetota bacterium]|nr:alpha/beta fold hydrolase [Actinomycetota bacterium]